MFFEPFFNFKILTPFLVSFLVSLLATPLVIKIYRHFKIFDDPQKHRHQKVTHDYPVPRGGGIPIFASLMTAVFFLPFDQHLKGILLGVAVALGVGILDDIFEEKIHPLIRLASNFIAAGIVVFSGIGIAFINNPLGGILRLDQPQICFYLFGQTRCLWLVADIFAILWIAWTMNFVGWSGGVEGQLPGVVAIAALTIAGLSLRFSADIAQWPVIILAVILAGAFLGFLVWNFYPQKIMPGYGGKTIAGFMLAVLSILSTAKVATLMLVLALPLIDAGYLVIKRMLTGHSPVWGGRDHLHHRLIALGWGKRRISVFYWLITALLGLIALQLNSRQKLYTIVSLVLVFVALIIWINYLLTSSRQRGQDSG